MTIAEAADAALDIERTSDRERRRGRYRKLTVYVPSDSDRRHIEAHLARSERDDLLPIRWVIPKRRDSYARVLRRARRGWARASVRRAKASPAHAQPEAR